MTSNNATNVKMKSKLQYKCPNIVIVPDKPVLESGHSSVAKPRNDCRAMVNTVDATTKANGVENYVATQNAAPDKNDTAVLPSDTIDVLDIPLPMATPDADNCMQNTTTSETTMILDTDIFKPSQITPSSQPENVKKAYVFIPDKAPTLYNEIRKITVLLPNPRPQPVNCLPRQMPCRPLPYSKQLMQPFLRPIWSLHLQPVSTPWLPPSSLHYDLPSLPQPMACYGTEFYSNKKSHTHRNNLLNVDLAAGNSNKNEELFLKSSTQIENEGHEKENSYTDSRNDEIPYIDLTSDNDDDIILNEESRQKIIEKNIIDHAYPVHIDSYKHDAVPIRVVDNECWSLLSNNTATLPNLNITNIVANNLHHGNLATTFRLTQEEILCEKYYAELCKAIEQNIDINLHDQHLEGKREEVVSLNEMFFKICDNTVTSSTEYANHDNKLLHSDSPVAKRPRYIPVSENKELPQIHIANCNLSNDHPDSTTKGYKTKKNPADSEFYTVIRNQSQEYLHKSNALPCFGSVKTSTQRLRDDGTENTVHILDEPLSPGENVDFLDDIDIDEIVYALKSHNADERPGIGQKKENFLNNNDDRSIRIEIDNIDANSLKRSSIMNNKYVNEGLKILESISIRPDNFTPAINKKCTDNAESCSIIHRENAVTNDNKEIATNKMALDLKIDMNKYRGKMTGLFQTTEVTKQSRDPRINSKDIEKLKTSSYKISSATITVTPKEINLAAQNKLSAKNQMKESISTNIKIKNTKRYVKEKQDFIKSTEKTSNLHAPKNISVTSNINFEIPKEKNNKSKIKHQPVNIIQNKYNKIALVDRIKSLECNGNLLKAKNRNKYEENLTSKICNKKLKSNTKHFSTKKLIIQNSSMGTIANSKFTLKNFTIPKTTKNGKCNEKEHLIETQKKYEKSNNEIQEIPGYTVNKDEILKNHYKKTPTKNDRELSEIKSKVDEVLSPISQKNTPIFSPEISRVLNELTNDTDYCELTEIKDEVSRLLAGIDVDDERSKVTVTTSSGKSFNNNDNQYISGMLNENYKKTHKNTIIEVDKSSENTQDRKVSFDRKRKSTLINENQKAKREMKNTDLKSITVKEKYKSNEINGSKHADSVELHSKSQLNRHSSLNVKVRKIINIKENKKPVKPPIETTTMYEKSNEKIVITQIPINTHSKIERLSNNRSKKISKTIMKKNKVTNNKTYKKQECKRIRENIDQQLVKRVINAGQHTTEEMLDNTKDVSQNSSKKIRKHSREKIENLLNSLNDTDIVKFSQSTEKQHQKVEINKTLGQKDTGQKLIAKVEYSSVEKIGDHNTDTSKIVDTAYVKISTLRDKITCSGNTHITVNSLKTKTEQITEKETTNFFVKNLTKGITNNSEIVEIAETEMPIFDKVKGLTGKHKFKTTTREAQNRSEHRQTDTEQSVTNTTNLSHYSGKAVHNTSVKSLPKSTENEDKVAINCKEKKWTTDKFGVAEKLKRKENVTQSGEQNTAANEIINRKTKRVPTKLDQHTEDKDTFVGKGNFQISTVKAEAVGKVNDRKLKCETEKVLKCEPLKNKEILKTNKASGKHPLKSNVYKEVHQQKELATKYKDPNVKSIPGYLPTMGATLAGRFNIKDVLHTGTNSCILRAGSKINVKANVALKILKKKWTAGHTVDILETLTKADKNDNFHIVGIQESFLSNSHRCLVMEYFERNLSEALEQNGGGFDICVVQELSRQLLKALMLLRVNQVIHSDIKPAHILINANNTKLKLCGFDQAIEEKNNLTVLPEMGTLNYRAPELILHVNSGYTIDIWSAACCMYELATSEILFKGASDDQVMGNMMQLNGEKLINCRFMKQNTKLNHNLRSKLVASYSMSENRHAIESKKVILFSELLHSMLCLDYKKRVLIEFAYLNPFIYK